MSEDVRVAVVACTEDDIWGLLGEPDPWLAERWQHSPHQDCEHPEFDPLGVCRLCARQKADCFPEATS